MTPPSQPATPGAFAADPVERRAVVDGLLAVGAGVANNALIKLLADVPTVQIVFLRAAGTVLTLAPAMARRGWKRPPAAVLVRAGCEAMATVLMLHALALTSLSFIATVMMAIPIGVMAVNWMLQGDALTPKGRVLLAVGFVGAMLATGPAVGSSLVGAVAAIASGGCYIARDVVTSRKASRASSLELSFFANLATLLLALALSAGLTWVPIRADQIVLIGGMIGLYILSNLLIASATRAKRSTLVAVTRYSAILWAVLLDLALFGTLPRPLTLVGAALIVGCGMGLVRTEKGRSRAA